MFCSFRWVYRENRVPHYQRLFQKHDGLRQWQKVGIALSSTASYEECNFNCSFTVHRRCD